MEKCYQAILCVQKSLLCHRDTGVVQIVSDESHRPLLDQLKDSMF